MTAWHVASCNRWTSPGSVVTWLATACLANGALGAPDRAGAPEATSAHVALEPVELRLAVIAVEQSPPRLEAPDSARLLAAHVPPATFDFSLALFPDETPPEETPGIEVEAEHLNRLGLFLGATTKGSHTGFTLGLEYERRLSDVVGLGIVTEWSPDGRELVVALPTLFVHPVGDLAVSISPGVAFEDGHTHALIRFGIGWEFELSHGWSIGPVVSYDLTEGTDDAVVYGLLLGYSF